MAGDEQNLETAPAADAAIEASASAKPSVDTDTLAAPPAEANPTTIISPIPAESPAGAEQHPQPENQPVPASQPAANLSEKFLQNMRDWQIGLTSAIAKKKQKRDLRLEKILQMAEANGGHIANIEVQKTFRCTQLTAYRYLVLLEKQGKLRRTGGHNTPSYELVK